MTQPEISFEFFPPRDAEGRARLVSNVANKLGALNPLYFSVTYGAGGSTRDGTRQTVESLQDAGHTAVPHLSIGNDGSDDIVGILDNYTKRGVDRIVTLRGDQPSGVGVNKFANNAEALVRLIREHSADRFKIVVAAYPEIHPDATSASSDLEFFARKVDAGADAALTQYFYNADAYADFLDRCGAAGIDIPITPGIMPITNADSIIRVSRKCGAEIPRWLYHGIRERAEDEKALVDYGVEVVSRLCERLLSLGAPGLHFYTLNRWGATTRVLKNLNLGG